MPTLEQAILSTIAYADIYQYPLTWPEVHRYLAELKASPADVHASLDQMMQAGWLDCLAGYYTLPGRTDLVFIRQFRRRTSANLWPAALRYGQWISRLPFVRMVAVTGSLSMDNAERGADLDYLVVTRPGRLWLARAMVILVVRLAALRGVKLCPNYFLSEDALALEERNLFTAHELAQMAPLFGMQVYARMRRLNRWVEDYLPNLGESWQISASPVARTSIFQRTGELILKNRLFDLLERWEMRRKVRKFSKFSDDHPEAAFDASRCKGHFDDHERAALEAYRERSQILQEDLGR